MAGSPDPLALHDFTLPEGLLLQRATEAGLPPNPDLLRWNEDQGVIVALLMRAGWRPGRSLVELGGGLGRGVCIAGPSSSWWSVEADPRLAALARLLAGEGAVRVVDTLDDVPDASRAGAVVLAWDLWPRLSAEALSDVLEAVFSKDPVKAADTLLLRVPADDPAAPGGVLHPWFGPVRPAELGAWGVVPRAAGALGLGVLRRSLHSDPRCVVWTISRTIPVDRRHRPPAS